MIKVASAKEMQHIDRVTIEKYGIAGIVVTLEDPINNVNINAE